MGIKTMGRYIGLFFFYNNPKKDLTTSIPPMIEPIEQKILQDTTTNKTLVTRFLKKPFNVLVSSAKPSKSRTLGLRTLISVRPANQPAASNGLIAVKGATIKETRIVRG